VTEAMDTSEYADESELADAMNPDVGAGSPETAPHEAVFDAEDEIGPDDDSGVAVDGDDDSVEDEDDEGPIDETI
jgi:hypothetical protein